jgi:hypothetical protein
MSIRSTVLGIVGALVFTAALGGIAKADDQMPAGAPGQQDSVEKSTGRDSDQGAPMNAGQDHSARTEEIDRDGKMMRAREEQAGREAPLDPRAEERAGRMDAERPNLSRSSPFSKGY